MDGTLLDLHFDSRFWLEHVPTVYGRARGLSRDEAWRVLAPRLKRVEGTLQWYCLDYWSRELGLDLARMKHELAHLIRFRDGAEAFLRRLRTGARQVILVTNAHQQSLSLKLARTGLDSLLDATVTSHELGYPKESRQFWRQFQERRPFDPARTLFLDDSLPVLHAARDYGIAHVLAIRQPDSRDAVFQAKDQIVDGMAQPFTTTLELGHRPLIRSLRVTASTGQVTKGAMALHHFEHLLGIGCPVRGQMQLSSRTQASREQRHQRRLHQSALVMTLLGPRVRKEDEHRIKARRLQRLAQQRDHIPSYHPEVFKPCSLGEAEQPADPRLVNLHAEIVALGVVSGHGGKGITHAETHLQVARSAAPEQQIQGSKLLGAGAEPVPQAVQGSGLGPGHPARPAHEAAYPARVRGFRGVVGLGQSY